MIERFGLGQYKANVYGLLWAILGMSTATALLQLDAPKGEVATIVTLALSFAVVFILWGMVWNLLIEPFYLEPEAGENA